MKTSNIIFISILGIMAIVLTTAAFSFKHTEIEKEANNKRFYQNIPSAKILLLENCKNLSFHQSDSSYIEYTVKDSVGSKVNFDVKGDTLFFFNVKSKNPDGWVKLYLSGKVTGFLVKNSNITLNDFAGRLFLNSDNSEITMSQKTGKKILKALDINGINDSNIFMSRFWIDSVHVKLLDSRAELRIGIGVFEGNILETSKLILQSPREMSLKRDEFSTIQNY